ncbi:two component transcriptional regulator, LuxR family [Pseudoxanthomonas sp. GM95]|uniref:LuxR C-terminal-related transcriptional regulator n=1 Tax=Pseudoxanthomonas sp. GM95 TaxID=1881043 RepID=UPI0008BDE0B7|nr:response regulator transcription factor [Pseudoxanthomonas sp. GM95]SEM40362.1 two component transcriptional regulator, LuxR family [Pseudoxanthomonas sp. GM95]
MDDAPRRPVRLYLLDDHTLFREGLRRLLDADPRFDVVGQSGVLAEALAQIATLAPDVVILDYDLGDATALDYMRQRATQPAGVATLVVTAGVSERDALELIRLGVSGLCRKDVSTDALIDSIDAVAMGRVLIEQRYLQSLVASSARQDRASFTDKEREVLKGLLRGQPNKQIARELGSSESAIKATFQQLFNKLDVRSRSQLVMVILQDYRDLV